MTTFRRFALTAAALVAFTGTARAQDQQPAADPDSADFSGDWDWAAQLRDGTLSGSWRLTIGENGRVTGVVTRSNAPSAPIRSFRVRRRSFTMTVDFEGDLYTFQGTLEGPRSVNGSISYRGGIGRLRAQRRGG